MKKVIEGAVYNTETAKKVCEQVTEAFEYEKDSDVKKLKQLYKTKSGKYFFFIKNEFVGYIDEKEDDLNLDLKLADLIEEKIVPISYDSAIQYASEILSDPDTDEASIERVGKYFPELAGGGIENNKKIQKKIYISPKISWYLEMLLIDTNHTNSSLIETLIFEEYERLYKKGIMNQDMFDELEE